MTFFPEAASESAAKTSDDDEVQSNGVNQKTVPATVNSFLKLLMNLMNAYNSGDEEEIECIWTLYCRQLNSQARLGGMVSSVARVNSVGMRVMLRQLPRSKAVTAILHNLMNWRELDCAAMFPKCGGMKEEGDDNAGEKEVETEMTKGEGEEAAENLNEN